MKQRLIYIIHDFKTGGVETALLSAIPRLIDEFDTYIFCIGKVDADFISALKQKEQKQIRQIHFPLILLPIAILKTAYELCKLQPDIIISSLWKSSWVGSFFKRINPKTTFISFIHSNKFHNAPDKFFTRKALKKCDVVFCDSYASKDFIQQYTFKKTIQIVSLLRFNTPAPPLPKKELNKQAIFMGRFAAAKRLDKLIHLIFELNCRDINISLDIFGRDDERLQEKLCLLISKLDLRNRVRFKGEISPSDIPSVLKQYDFYMQTSENEGMAMSVVEAMQMGVVPIVTPVGEIFHYAKNMENAILLDIEHPETSFTDILNITLNIDLYHQMAQKANETFKNKIIFAESLIQNIKNSL